MSGGGRGDVRSHQVQFPSIQELPLHALAGFQPDRDRQGERETHIEPGLLAFRADRLNA